MSSGWTAPAPPAARTTGIGGTVAAAAVKIALVMTIDPTNAPAMDALQSEDGNSNPLVAGERSLTCKQLPLRLTIERAPAVMAEPNLCTACMRGGCVLEKKVE